MKQKQVDHYGLHQSPNGLWFLLQDDEQNERGLANVRSNLTTKVYRGDSSTHSIRLGDGELDSDSRSTFEYLKNTPLGRTLLPNPDNAGKVVFVEDDLLPMEYVYHALNLTSPVGASPVRPSWMLTLPEARIQSRMTNVQPFVITEVTPKWMTDHGAKVTSIFRAGTRPLIFIGSSDVVLPRDIKRLKPTVFRRLRNISPRLLRKVGAASVKEWISNARS